MEVEELLRQEQAEQEEKTDTAETPETPEQEATPEKPSRRSKRVDRLEEQFRQHTATLDAERAERKAEREERQRELAQLREENARVNGTLEEIRRRPSDTPPEEDPDELRRKAEAAVKGGDFDTFRSLDRRATQIEQKALADRVQRETIAAMRSQMPQAPDPMMQVFMSKYPDVALHPNGFNAVEAEARHLHAYGEPKGPGLLAKAWENANKRLTAKPATQQAPRYDSRAAGALAAMSPGAGAAGGGGDDDDDRPLTGLEADAARGARMTPRKYREWQRAGR